MLLMLPTFSWAADAADDSTADYEVPAPRFLRYDEDWSVLADVPQQAVTRSHRHKYVKLTADGNVWASFGGHARLRIESWNGFAFGTPDPDRDTFALWRILTHMDLHWGKTFRWFTEIKHADASDRTLPGGKRPLDVDQLTFEQLFVDLSSPSGFITGRLGRQSFSFGRQRLISPLPWANTLNRWDGVRGMFAAGDWTIDAWYSNYVPVLKHEFNRTDQDEVLYGAYASHRGLDLYWIGFRDVNRSYNGTTGKERRETIGVRFGDTIGSRASYDIEASYQFGDLGSDDIKAWMVASLFDYRLSTNIKWNVGYDYASGDDSPGGQVGTFNQLRPLAHAYYGFADHVGRQNAVDLHSGLAWNIQPATTIAADVHLLRRASNRDALYNAGAVPIRAGDAGTSKSIGTELDLTLRHRLTNGLSFLLGYSHIFAGEFIKQSGASRDVQLLYGQAVYQF